MFMIRITITYIEQYCRKIMTKKQIIENPYWWCIFEAAAMIFQNQEL